jgi:hypothetical protein
MIEIETETAVNDGIFVEAELEAGACATQLDLALQRRGPYGPCEGDLMWGGALIPAGTDIGVAVRCSCFDGVLAVAAAVLEGKAL